MFLGVILSMFLGTLLGMIFGMLFPSELLKTRTVGCPETSVQNYNSVLRNIPEERRYHLHRCRSLKSRTIRLEDLGIDGRIILI
jgi:hypothetical protein